MTGLVQFQNPVWNYIKSEDINIPKTSQSQIEVPNIFFRKDKLPQYVVNESKKVDNNSVRSNEVVEAPVVNQAVNKVPLNNSDGLVNAFSFARKWEGGFTPNDVGSPANMGIRLANNKNMIPDYNKDGKIDVNDVKALTVPDAQRIYEQSYWKPSRASELSNPIGMYFADTAFNQGLGGANSVLRNALNSMGASTQGDMIETAKGLEQKALLDALHSARLARYKGTQGYNVYGNGWNNRINDLYNITSGMLK